MKKSILFILSSIMFSFGHSQTLPKINNYPLGNSEVNVIVMPFGMDNPIIIGSMSKSGEIKFDLPKQLPKLSKESEENFISNVAYTLFDVCDNSSEIVSDNNIVSFDTGALTLATTENPYAGVIFSVSDENLMPWVEDSAYMEPILGSYFELIYLASAFQYKGECNQTRMMDVGDAKITYQYNLNLKAGFNFIEYKIENIHKTDPNVMASFPDKVSVTNVDGIPNCKWIGRYF